MPKPMSRYKPIEAEKEPLHAFGKVTGVYMERGHVKNYANKTQAQARVRLLQGLGFQCFMTARWPFTIRQEKTQDTGGDANALTVNA